MSYYYGYGQRHLQNYGGLKKKVDDLIKKFNALSINNDHYKTVFEINLKTAKKTIKNSRCVKARNGKYVLSQEDSTLAPTYGSDYVENDANNYMIFCCPELQFGNISIFVVSETSDTYGLGSWRFIIGNDDGAYDKYIAYKVLAFDKVVHGGGINPGGQYINTLPIFSVMDKKIILSCHWQISGSCVYFNGVKVSGSDFQANLKHIGSPFGSVFFNERFTDASSLNHDKLIGKIYGFKIVTGVLTPSDIVKIQNDMIEEYDVDV